MRIRDGRAASGTFELPPAESTKSTQSNFVPAALAGRPLHEAPVWFTQQTPELQALLGNGGLSEQRRVVYDWHGRRRGDAQFALFQYTLSGTGMLTHGGVTRPVTPGTAMLLTMPGDHRYWLPEGGRWRFFFLCLYGRDVMQAWRAVIARTGALVPMTADDPVVVAAAEGCAAVLNGAVATPYASAAHAYRLTMLLMDRGLSTAASGAQTKDAARAATPGLDAACAHARAHFQRDLSVDDLARVAGMSRAHFTRRFAAAFGLAPAAFLTDQRLRHAAELLRDRKQPIATIAHACGYRDPAYFGRAFRRALGVSPGAFRDSGLFG